MGVIVSLMEDIKGRILGAMEDDGTLEDIKRFNIGSFDETRKPNDMPIINMRLTAGEDKAKSTSNISVNKPIIEIILMDNKLALIPTETNNNDLYKTSDSSGILFLFESLLNALDLTTSGGVDITFGGTADDLRVITYDIDDSQEGLYKIVINIDVETKQFSNGDR